MIKSHVERVETYLAGQVLAKLDQAGGLLQLLQALRSVIRTDTRDVCAAVGQGVGVNLRLMGATFSTPACVVSKSR